MMLFFCTSKNTLTKTFSINSYSRFCESNFDFPCVGSDITRNTTDALKNAASPLSALNEGTLFAIRIIDSKLFQSQGDPPRGHSTAVFVRFRSPSLHCAFFHDAKRKRKRETRAFVSQWRDLSALRERIRLFTSRVLRGDGRSLETVARTYVHARKKKVRKNLRTQQTSSSRDILAIHRSADDKSSTGGYCAESYLSARRFLPAAYCNIQDVTKFADVLLMINSLIKNVE